MPTYEYRCPECGTEFDKFQKMSEEPVADCPACGRQAQRRISAGAGLVFKGSGFYITDYQRGEGYKKAAEGEKGGAAPEGKPSTESKPSDAGAAPPKAEAKPAPKSE